jgi:hypothetical protein
MRQIGIFAIAGILPIFLFLHAAHAGTVVVGANAYGADIKQIAENGVKTLRISLLPGVPVDFVIQAYQHGPGQWSSCIPLSDRKRNRRDFGHVCPSRNSVRRNSSRVQTDAG